MNITHAFFIQYYWRKQWKKTYYGNRLDKESGLYYYETIQEAKDEIERYHEYQRDVAHKKTLTKYRIVERIIHSTIHDI
jgi:hypothetical protein